MKIKKAIKPAEFCSFETRDDIMNDIKLRVLLGKMLYEQICSCFYCLWNKRNIMKQLFLVLKDKI